MVCPDIKPSVNICAAFASNPGMIHWKALRRIAAYLYHTRHRGFVFGANRDSVDLNNLIHVYTDADLAGCLDTNKSPSNTQKS